ncbi:phosphate propanoyltransferase [Fredinandcohnia quinoae]|uniref:Phosphate propanoyltransferase n=1 Tax=Fredinandcohnia quinoae TaxID=2918902 RepID=A0AAW5E1Z4_9BACI|nr:phosphate propanoyltransferase [Fredinandcohnia sp. SECRCQ15]MCH1624021.1 phosphate propanoyltransferase [Fredinandcohnia sp. SECRCQ15]
MALITEKNLRQLFVQRKLPNPFILNSNEKMTPAARDFLNERKIAIIFAEKQKNPLTHSHIQIPVGVSNRHVHLSNEHAAILFGANERLVEERPLSQPGQFASKQRVTLVGPNGVIENVRVLGPERERTQIEISRTDGFSLGIHPPVRLSGSIEGTPGITLVGTAGSVTVKEGLIIAKNHVHMSSKNSKNLNIKHGDSIVLLSKMRNIIFSDVIVRVKDSYQLDFHIDLDEANASGLSTNDHVVMIGKNGQLFSDCIGDVADD